MIKIHKSYVRRQSQSYHWFPWRVEQTLFRFEPKPESWGDTTHCVFRDVDCLILPDGPSLLFEWKVRRGYRFSFFEIRADSILKGPDPRKAIQKTRHLCCFGETGLLQAPNCCSMRPTLSTIERDANHRAVGRWWPLGVPMFSTSILVIFLYLQVHSWQGPHEFVGRSDCTWCLWKCVNNSQRMV